MTKKWPLVSGSSPLALCKSVLKMLCSSAPVGDASYASYGPDAETSADEGSGMNEIFPVTVDFRMQATENISVFDWQNYEKGRLGRLGICV